MSFAAGKLGQLVCILRASLLVGPPSLAEIRSPPATNREMNPRQNKRHPLAWLARMELLKLEFISRLDVGRWRRLEPQQPASVQWIDSN